MDGYGSPADQLLSSVVRSPKVSVILPVYNCQDYLHRAIDSILGQTFTDFEFIIIDDGSSDNSLKIIEAYNDARIVLIRHEKNMGLVASLNKGIDAAQGTYIAVMHGDGISKPERLARQVEFMDCHPNIAVCGSWVETFGECAKTVWGYPIDPGLAKCSLLFRNIIAHPSVLMRRNILISEGMRYLDLYPHAEDYALWVTIAKKYDITNLPQVLLKHRITSKFKQQQLAATAKIQLEQINALGITPTEQEYSLHQAISLGKFPKSDAFFEAVLLWFTKLKHANLTRGYYPEPAFTYVLRQYLAVVCKATKANGCENALQYL
ncbi:glycosyl transferase, family 2 [Thermosinus carboxydivorans Nor1]|uniref:Glycosyl transferase, family 2 n=1 Tax=Thermosinus carboxydivorans Nor1 TaxID=401526 RepID=A1HNS9_9FIRM|nr:glycosyltransferase family 2 protein [Thermosinus carboxydivorans]EAX48431.1 glycosyl transferase, family 2 [Thermosinus carboxydivorans Nor1]